MRLPNSALWPADPSASWTPSRTASSAELFSVIDLGDVEALPKCIGYAIDKL
ncbi:hypothetical protein ACH47Z_23575 [Streptomyces sp. NPDC020192]|uniref:hypothetical protein n=1 Tax=Streptomyces sp. NPDC020192 TaxID=3365066 RepID=UPI003790BE57